MPMICVRDIELYYELHGDDGPVILLVHGLGSSLADWEHQIDELARRYRVLSVDLRGHGKSSRRGPITIADFAADLHALLTALDLRSVYLAGISMGTAVAFQLALDYPENVVGIVIINGGPMGPSSTDPVHRSEIQMRISAVELHGMRRMGELLASRLLPAPAHAPMRETFVERWATNDPAMYLESLGAMVDWSVRDRLASLAIPCGVITGDRDYTPISFKEEYMRDLPRSELVVIADSGHMTTHDQPSALTAAILRFIDQWTLMTKPQPRGRSAA